MGASKTDFFTQEQNDLAVLFKAISHPARIAIIQFLLSVIIRYHFPLLKCFNILPITIS